LLLMIAAQKLRHAAHGLRRHPVALVHIRYFRFHEGALVAVLRKVGFGATGQAVSPRGSEVGTRLLERRGYAIRAGAAM
jgi:hypothetical protein